MTALTALGPVWVALFLFVIGEWAWHFVRIKRLLRDPPQAVAERVAALDDQFVHGPPEVAWAGRAGGVVPG